MEENMFGVLHKAVQSGDLARTEQLINKESASTSTRLTFEQGSVLLKTAIRTKHLELIQALVKGRVMEDESCPHAYLEPLNGRTIFGYAVFDQFDEEVIKLLASNGYDELCTDECAELVSNLTQNYNTNDLSNFALHIDRLKLVLTTCSRVHVQKTLRTMLYNELKNSEIVNSIEWLKYHFEYGYGVSRFNTINKIHMELGEGMWSDAINSIKALDENEANEYFYDSYPPDDDIPRWTILGYAVSKGKDDIVKVLIEKGADVNKHSERVEDGRLIKVTPFELAVYLNFLECCSLLVKHGANLYLQSCNFMGDILKNAIRHENIALLKLILQNRRYCDEDIVLCATDVTQEVQDIEIQSEMLNCLTAYRRFETTEVTNVVKALMIFKDGTQQEALECIQKLSTEDLNEEVRPCSCSGQVWTLLAYATKLNKLAIVKSLLGRGCDVNHIARLMRNSNEFKVKAPLIIAIEENNFDICKVLLDHGAHMKYYTYSVLPHAFRQKNQQILKLLIKRLDDPYLVFNEYFYFVDRSISLSDMLDTFELDLLCYVLQKSRITENRWCNLIYGCSRRSINAGVRRGRHYFLNMLLHFFPTAPVELQRVLSISKELHQNLRQVEISSGKERDWIRQNIVRSSSLQNLCRFAVRKAVHPFTKTSVQTLGLPVQLQEYLLEHPLRAISSQITKEDLSNPLSQQRDQLHFYVDH